MLSSMRIHALVLAGGSGDRFWAEMSKPFVRPAGEPILVVPDLADYERDPGLYLDSRSEMIGTQVADTEGGIRAHRDDAFNVAPYDAFVRPHLHDCDGASAARFVQRLLPAPPGRAESTAIP